MNKDIVPELLMKDSNPHTIAKELLKILDDEQYRNNMIEDLSRVKQMLSKHEAAKEVAQIISTELKNDQKA